MALKFSALIKRPLLKDARLKVNIGKFILKYLKNRKSLF